MTVRNLGLSKVSRAGSVIAVIVLILALLAAVIGYRMYKKATTTTVSAEFADALAVYPGDRVQIMGVKVGSIDKIEPTGNGDRMKVTFSYDSKYKVPADAVATVLNPTVLRFLVACSVD